MILEKYLLQEGTIEPEGTKVIECEMCSRKFAVPIEEARTLVEHMCETCKAKMDAAATEADMVSNSKTEDEKQKALGA